MNIRIIMIFLILTSCNFLQKKYIIEISNYEQDIITGNRTIEHIQNEIKAISDSAAYAEGFMEFCIRAKIFKQFNKPSLPKPIAFRVLDKKNIDVAFDLSDSLQRLIQTNILESFKNEHNKDSIARIINANDRILYIQNILDN